MSLIPYWLFGFHPSPCILVKGRDGGRQLNSIDKTEGFRVQARLSRELVPDHFPISTHIRREQLVARILGTGLKAARVVSPVGNFEQIQNKG